MPATAARLNVGGVRHDATMQTPTTPSRVDCIVDPALTLVWVAPHFEGAQHSSQISLESANVELTDKKVLSDDPSTLLNSSQDPDSATTASDEFLKELESVVDDLSTVEREINRLEARKQASLNRAVQLIIDDADQSGSCDARNEITRRSVQECIGLALRRTGRTVSVWMDAAYRLINSYPAAFETLSAGQLPLQHVQIIADEGTIIRDDAKRERYEAETLEFANTASTKRLRMYAKRLAEQLTDDSLHDRHATARLQRGVWVEQASDGMAWLRALLPATEAAAIHERLSHVAWQLRSTDAFDGDGVQDQAVKTGSTAGLVTPSEESSAPPVVPRSMHERRADALIDLVLQADPFALGLLPQSGGSRRPRLDARVQVVIPIMTLIDQDPADCLPGLDRFAGLFGPAECSGMGPMSPRAARLIAGEIDVWERVLVHPISGTVLEVDRYRPSESMRRLLGARDQHCRFPGCTAPVSRCDLDHTYDHSLGGATHLDNLSHLCRHHHTLKHHSSWDVMQAEPGVMRWRSPIGQEFIDRPPSQVRFRPVPESHAPPGRESPPF